MSGDGLAEEEGEGYFASISDLMVGVLFVFLLMLTVFALNFRDDSARLDELITRLERAEHAADAARLEAERQRIEAERQQVIAHEAQVIAEREAERARLREEEAARLRAQNEALRARLQEAAEALTRELAGREAARDGLLRRLARGLEAREIRFILDERSGVLRLSDAVPFAPGRSDLTDPRARRTVTALAEVLAEALPCFAQGAAAQSCGADDAAILEAVLVEGHTDRQGYPNMSPTQSQQQNDLLSTSRALTVFAELRRQQPALEALRNPSDQPLLGVSGYGERRPLPDALTMSGDDLAQNRRIDLRFVLSARTSDELRRLLGEIAALQQEGQR
ncbi:MAG TPA: hypothetical protein VGM87_07810 [Roseomonas sp.]|jgi:flagellar motor protein MotB